jgi:hypothetical protein
MKNFMPLINLMAAEVAVSSKITGIIIIRSIPIMKSNITNKGSMKII